MGLSEIGGLNRRSPGYAGNEYILDDPFWAQVSDNYFKSKRSQLSEVLFHLPRRNALLHSKPKSWDQSNEAALRSIKEISGKKILVDASKTPERLWALLQSPLFRVKVIYLVRDGRAVLNAYHRKYGSWLKGYKKLMRVNRLAHSIQRTYPETPWLVVRYEDFVSHTELTLREICSLAGVKFEQCMLHPDTSNFHGIGGNRLRKKPVQGISLDEAWRLEMSPTTQFLAGMAVRGFNLRMGYDK